MQITRSSRLLYLALIVLLSSCTKTYRGTAHVCDGKLYVEIFRIVPIGGDIDYLTDSANFRLYIGSSDPEQTTYTYDCEGDSIIIKEVTLNRGEMYELHKVLSRNAYSLQELKDKHNY